MIEGATSLLTVEGQTNVPDEFIKALPSIVDIGRNHDITTSYYYGFKQLMEIAIKALSPGINDTWDVHSESPGTV